MTVIPAYGRDYSSAKQAREDWFNGKDFQIADIGNPWNDSYCSKRDRIDEPVVIYFNRQTRFTTIMQGDEK